MLTRLRVTGFKNMVDMDVYLGPFTCVAGANAVGKSNLFDAIHFLSALADRPLIDAALNPKTGQGIPRPFPKNRRPCAKKRAGWLIAKISGSLRFLWSDE